MARTGGSGRSGWSKAPVTRAARFALGLRELTALAPTPDNPEL